jgi:hypothetical protein
VSLTHPNDPNPTRHVPATLHLRPSGPPVNGHLRELARVTRPTGLLILFHPSGRAALAARHGRTLRDDETLAAHRLTALLQATGWILRRYDDAQHRFFAVAGRTRS